MLSKTELREMADRLHQHGSEVGEVNGGKSFIAASMLIKKSIGDIKIKLPPYGGTKKKMIAEKYGSYNVESGAPKSFEDKFSGMVLGKRAPKSKKMIAQKYYSSTAGHIAEEETGRDFGTRGVEMMIGRKKPMIAKKYGSYNMEEPIQKPKAYEQDFEAIVLGKKKKMIAQKYYSASDPTDTTIDPTWTTRPVGKRRNQGF
jgi:hypothetical protein